MLGIIKYLNKEKKFGFIQSEEGGEDAHFSFIHIFGAENAHIGDKVTYKEIKNYYQGGVTKITAYGAINLGEILSENEILNLEDWIKVYPILEDYIYIVENIQGEILGFYIRPNGYSRPNFKSGYFKKNPEPEGSIIKRYDGEEFPVINGELLLTKQQVLERELAETKELKTHNEKTIKKAKEKKEIIKKMFEESINISDIVRVIVPKDGYDDIRYFYEKDINNLISQNKISEEYCGEQEFTAEAKKIEIKGFENPFIKKEIYISTEGDISKGEKEIPNIKTYLKYDLLIETKGGKIILEDGTETDLKKGEVLYDLIFDGKEYYESYWLDSYFY